MAIETNEERLFFIISDCLDVEKDQISLETKFVDDLGVDSLSFMELIMSIEEEFEVELPETEVRKIKTVQDALNRVKDLQN